MCTPLCSKKKIYDTNRKKHEKVLQFLILEKALLVTSKLFFNATRAVFLKLLF